MLHSRFNACSINGPWQRLPIDIPLNSRSNNDDKYDVMTGSGAAAACLTVQAAGSGKTMIRLGAHADISG